MNKTAMRALYKSAHAAGMAAGKAAVPTPMTVYSADLFDRPIPGTPTYYVPDGPCGFAWISVRPGNSAFANWLKKNDLGRTDSYAGGVSVWVRDFGQSHARKVAYADAFARVLTDAGITAYAADRLD